MHINHCHVANVRQWDRLISVIDSFLLVPLMMFVESLLSTEIFFHLCEFINLEGIEFRDITMMCCAYVTKRFDKWKQLLRYKHLVSCQQYVVCLKIKQCQFIGWIAVVVKLLVYYND